MSKYIRTKDGIFVLLGKAKDTFLTGKTPVDFGTYIDKNDIIKEANTIEDLCDEIVIIDTCGGCRPAIKRRFLGTFQLLGDWLEDNKQDNRYRFYGAVWTEWGLKYVARMNNEREMELI